MCVCVCELSHISYFVPLLTEGRYCWRTDLFVKPYWEHPNWQNDLVPICSKARGTSDRVGALCQCLSQHVQFLTEFCQNFESDNNVTDILYIFLREVSVGLWV